MDFLRNVINKKPQSMEKVADISPMESKKSSMIITAGELSKENKDFSCRICMDLGDANIEMCAPCDCTGTIQYIHVSCLKEWIKEKKSIKCELCGQTYSNTWKMWAFKNKVIKTDIKFLSVYEKIMMGIKVIVILYIQIIFVYSMLIFNN